MDGQQRLTSLYIGLQGSFSDRDFRKKRKKNSSYTERELYLPLERQESEDPRENTETSNPDIKNYNFTFLSKREHKSKKEEGKNYWFPVSKILKLEEISEESQIKEEIIRPLLKEYALKDPSFAEETLDKLYRIIRIKKTIHFFNEEKQDAERILESFIRVNTGGVNLTQAQLIESIIVSNWKGDFRREQSKLIKEIQERGFFYSEKWEVQKLQSLILKISLMLTETDIELNVKNFKAIQVKKIEEEWEEIKECLKETFIFIKKIGINNESLDKENTIIPICYYLYKKKIIKNEPLYKMINNSAKKEEKDRISHFLYISLIKKNIFKANGLDNFLSSMRKTLKESIETTNFFPIDEITERYKGTKKDFTFTENDLEELVDLEYEDRRCKPLLHLIFMEKDPDVTFHKDHLHPRSSFLNIKNLKNLDFLKNNEELLNFYLNKKHWNSLANLQLLDKNQNSKKSNKPLKKWIAEESHSLSEKDIMCDNISLEFEDFSEFYFQRREKLKERLKQRVFVEN